MKLKDRVAIVTGSTQGIGRAIALKLAAEGAVICVVASREGGRADAVAEEIRRVGGRATDHVADVRDSGALARLTEEVLTARRRIDILVNCAGTFLPTPAGSASEAEVDRLIETNLKGTFMMINAVVPAMRAQRSGRIINISSVAGFMGFSGYAMYCATKAGVAIMTRALACELAPHGIQVNAIAPGNTATPMNEAVRTSVEYRPMLEAMAARTPSGRTFSAAEDIAGMALFLATDDARSMHGTTVLMDEGLSAGM